MLRSPLICVAYHHFAANPCPMTRHLNITTDPDVLWRHVDHFRTNFNVVGLDQVLSGDLPERALLITMDDAYRSALDVGTEVLKAARLPAVLFLNPRVASEPYVPLDNVLSIAVSEMGLSRVAAQAGVAAAPETLGALIGGSIAVLRPSEREALKTHLLGLLGVDEADLAEASGLFLNREEVAALSARGVEIANHTFSHAHCRSLTQSDLMAEIAGGKRAIEQMTGKPVRAFSFPYGHERDATPAALKVLRKSGHRALFLVHARSNRVRPAPDIWYRTTITSEPVGQLSWRLKLMSELRTLRSASKRLVSGVG